MFAGWKKQPRPGPPGGVRAKDDLDELDVAVEPAEVSPATGRAGEPAPLSPDDPVPLFRADLRVARGASPGLLEVSDPGRGKTFTLYEFELGVARMLDGRRPASEVVASGARLGIPIDLKGLNEFVRQMWHYGFLAPPGTAPDRGEAGTWAEREPWDESTRELFQTGVRLLRSGRGDAAAGYFEAVLDAHPGNAEATEMLALIASGKPLAAAPVGGRPVSAQAARPGRRRRAAAIAIVAAAGLGAAGFAALRLPRGSPPTPQAAAPPESPSPTPAAAPVPPAGPPPPTWRSGPVETRRLARLAEVIAPDGGAIRWRKRSGATVRKGERLGEVRVTTAGGASSPELARRIAELERLAAQDPVYRDFLEQARREQRRSTRGRTRALAVVAPAAGTFALPPVAPSRAEEGTVLGWIVDPARWQLGTVLEGDPPPLDAECEVLGDDPGERAGCTLLDASAVDAGRVAVTAEVEEAAARWIGRAQSPYVRIAPPGSGRAAP